MPISTRRLVGRLLAALSGSALTAAYLSKSIRTLRHEVRRLSTSARQHKAHDRRARERLAEAKDRLSAVERAHAETRSSAQRLRSSAVDAAHLGSILPLRASAIRAVRDGAAAAREETFAALSHAYRSAKRAWSAGERPDGVRNISSAGVLWSVPADGSDEHSLAGRVERGWLPLQDIAIVRSCAVGGVMLDIGANIGTTCIPRVVLGDFECVYAAEPDAANYSCLVGNVIDNGLAGRILPERVAIAGWTGAADLQQAAGIGSHHLVRHAGHARHAVTRVLCFTLDSWLAHLGVAPARVTFVKVDVQGWDVEVLKSASTLLEQKHVVWQLEISRLLERTGSTLDAAAAFLRAHFTHVKEIDGRSTALRPVAEVTARFHELAERETYTNLLLLNRA